MDRNYFEELLHSIATSRLLLQKASANQAAIEGLCLYVSLVDALLRLALIYTRVQRSPNKRYSIEKKILRQDEGEKTFSEREIYDLALKEEVISEALYNELQDMYRFRNRVVHRFNISGLQYTEIAEGCSRFESIFQEVMKIIDKLENGPHGPRPIEETAMERVREGIFRKIKA